MNVITSKTLRLNASAFITTFTCLNDRSILRGLFKTIKCTTCCTYHNTRKYRIFQPSLRNNPSVTQVRTFCTVKNLDSQKAPDEPVVPPTIVNHTNDNHTEEHNVNKLYPKPKNTLHNIYDVVAREFKNNNLKVAPEFKIGKKTKSGNMWTCTYHLKWPEEKAFTYAAYTKQDAAYRAALQALLYLKSARKITKEGQPLMYDKEQVIDLKKQAPPLVLNAHAQRKLGEIAEKYDSELLPEFSKVDVSKSGSVASESGRSFLDSSFRLPLKQRFEGLSVYEAKESVKLPISEYRDKFVELLNSNSVVVIKGEPGCGKSTRIPQYVLESWAKNANSHGDSCRIVVSQPRRIAAISLAARVANERNENVGDIVGFQVRFNSNVSNRTRIMYCTTGILLRHLQSDQTLSNYTHILLDEAHERDVNTDLLMNLLRNAVNVNPRLKLIIMSATIDTKAFQNYFHDAPTLNIPGFTYPVRTNFLNDLKKSLKLNKTSEMCEQVEPFVVHEEVASVINYLHKTKDEGAILCFLPGWEDIVKVRNLLASTQESYVLCLHSRLQDSEQRKIFSRPPPGVRKIILATNIAETSVTVDDVVYVVDTGVHKEERFDADKGVSAVDNHWISQSSMTQRKGRAGRVRPGESYHLYTKEKHETFPKYSMPEILRTSLTKIVLDSKVFSNNMNALEFFSQLPSPPDENAVLKAVEELRELELLDRDECLTPLGRVLADFQLEPKLSRALVNSIVFKCVTPVVDVVTLFSADSGVFSTGLMDKEGVREVKRRFSNTSDHEAMTHLFENWLDAQERGDFTLANEFCARFHLVPYKLRTMQKLRELHFEYLYKGFRGILPISDDFSDSEDIVKGALLSGVGTVLQHRNWDIVKGRMKIADIFLTRNNHKATVTPDSINFKKCVSYKNKFLLYINETRSNARRMTMIRECSLVSPLLVLLFKNDDLIIQDISPEMYSKEVDSDDQVLVRLEGTQIKFFCDRELALKIQKCKSVIKDGLRYFVYQMTVGKDYDTRVYKQWHGTLKVLSDLLQNVK